MREKERKGQAKVIDVPTYKHAVIFSSNIKISRENVSPFLLCDNLYLFISLCISVYLTDLSTMFSVYVWISIFLSNSFLLFL